MRTIALRFAENFAPDGGTIKAHQLLIDKYGYVWYGKMGTRVGLDKQEEIMKNNQPRILLIQSGKLKRYWAYIKEIKDKPEKSKVPSYYRSEIDKFNTWFKVIRFEEADRDIMSKCYVVSSGAQLGSASKYSMSPYFYIETEE